MKNETISEMEALQNAVNYNELSKFNLSLREKFFEDKRKTTKMFFLHNDKTGATISPVLNYENMNHFLLGFSRAKKLFTDKKPKSEMFTRLHAWDTDRSAYYITHDTEQAAEDLREEGYTVDFATNQSQEIFLTDIELYLNDFTGTK